MKSNQELSGRLFGADLSYKGYRLALIKCKECNNEVSTEAKICPKCGAPVMASIKFLNMLTKAVFLIGLIFLIIIWFTISNNKSDNHAGVQKTEITPEIQTQNQVIQSTNTDADAEKTNQIIRISVADLFDKYTQYDNYKQSNLASMKEFGGKIIELSGVVKDVEKIQSAAGGEDELHVIFRTNNESQNVRAIMMDSSLRNEAALATNALNQGSTIKVLCKLALKTQSNELRLLGCEFVSN